MWRKGGGLMGRGWGVVTGGCRGEVMRMHVTETGVFNRFYAFGLDFNRVIPGF